MSPERTDRSRRQQNARLFPSRAARPKRSGLPSVDVSISEGYLHITFEAAEIDDAELRYTLRRRYLIVWGENSPHQEQRFVHLPAKVDPSDHKVRFQNGVFDLRAKIAATKPI